MSKVKSITTKTVFMYHIPHRLVLVKLVTCKATFQISEIPKTQILIFMSQLDIDPNSDTGDKWRVPASAEPLVSQLPDTTELEMLSGWLGS